MLSLCHHALVSWIPGKKKIARHGIQHLACVHGFLQPAYARSADVIVAQVDNLYACQAIQICCQSIAFPRLQAQFVQIQRFDPHKSLVPNTRCVPRDSSCRSGYAAQLLRKRDGAQEHADGHRANVMVEAAGLGTERPLRDHSPTHVAYCVEDLLPMHVHQTLCGTQCLCTERRFDNMQPRRQRAKTVVGHVDRLPELELQQGVVVILRRN